VSLVLSLFPGIGLLDRAFELEGFCVVRGPDLLWGGDIKTFPPPAGVFDGVIGGPPCQVFSVLKRLNPKAGKHGNLIPEFERVVGEVRPRWFVMENVPAAPMPCVKDYGVTRAPLDNRQLGEAQSRPRIFLFGRKYSPGVHLRIPTVALESIEYSPAVCSDARQVPAAIGGSGKPKRIQARGGYRQGPGMGPRMSVAKMLELQGFPGDMLDECPFTAEGKRKAIGNGVPLPMGRAIAKAVRRALEEQAA